jgi:hypothetical protein
VAQFQSTRGLTMLPAVPSAALQFLQQHPQLTTNSPEFRNLGLGDDQCCQLAYQLIESYPFIGQTITVYNSKGVSSKTMPVNASRANYIKRYLKAFIDVDRSALEIHIPGFNAAEAKRRMIHQIIDRRQELYRVYTEYKRDVVERSASFPLLCPTLFLTRYTARAKTALASPTPGTPRVQTTWVASFPQKVCDSEQNIRQPSALITLFQVRDRDGGVCRITGVGSLSYWQDRRELEEAFAKNVGYGCYLNCEVAHAMPWNIDQPVRNVYVCMLSLAKCCWRLVLGSYSKTLGHIWSAR